MNTRSDRLCGPMLQQAGLCTTGAEAEKPANSLKVAPLLVVGAATIFLMQGLSRHVQGGENSESSKLMQTNGLDLHALIISSVGTERKPIIPVVLYTDERGWDRRFVYLSRDKAVEGEKCEGQLLVKILIEASKTFHWVEGYYGDTELLFIRTNRKTLAIAMDKHDATAVFESVRADLMPKSPVWRYLRYVNKFEKTDSR